MKFTLGQLELLSKYFADVSKILVASTVIGFFIPSSGEFVTPPVFIGGLAISVALLIFSLILTRPT